MKYPYSIPTEYYGDQHRWFVGTVVNSNPPPGYEGRVRIRIQGVHNLYTGDVKESDLPWAQVLIPATEGGISGLGRIPQLTAGSFVFGVFLDGKTSQLPLVLGSFPRVELPTVVQTKANQGADSFNYNQEKLINVVISQLDNDTQRSGSVDQRRSQAIKFFIENGYRPLHAACITGSLEAISKFVTYEQEEDSLRQGIAHWELKKNGRLNNLKTFSQFYEPKSSWKNFSVQLQFVVYELKTTQRLANIKLLRSDNFEDGTNAITKYYLKQSASGASSLAEKAYDGAFA